MTVASVDSMTTLMRFARFFAAQKHKDQFYAGGLPYTHHLLDVENTLRRFGFNEEELLVAAWLHDVVEDTDTKLKDISELFGDRVAELVGAVTNEEGPNRKVRSALTYPKIRHTPGATALKLADRIANTTTGGKLLAMYKKEYPDFRWGLHARARAGATDARVKAMWEALDELMEWV